MKKLKVQSDYGFGLWCPEANDPELLGLPQDLCTRFHAWLRRYHEHDGAPPGFDRVKYNDEGRMLAREIKAFLGREYQLSYRYLLPPTHPKDFEFQVEDVP